MADGSLSVFLRALRSLRRSPGFVAIAAVSLGTALGLSTAVFAMMDAMTHPQSAYRKVEQLYSVIIRQHSKLGPGRDEVMKALTEVEQVQGVGSYRWDYDEIEAGEGVERRAVFFTRPGFMELLGVKPRLGRLFSIEESAGMPVALVSDGLWRRRFDSRRVIGNATITFRASQFRVVGVIEPGTAWTNSQAPDVWIPDALGERGGVGAPVVRLRGGLADTSGAQERLQAILKRWTLAYAQPKEAPFSGRLDAMRPDPLELKDFHRAMIGAAVCVLLIACANVAALMLARGLVRRRDYALRMALGAGPGEIAREVLVETVVLAAAGSVLGAVFSTWVVGLITRATPDEMHWVGFVQPQWSVRVLALSALAVLASVSIAGGFPAWRASRTDPAGPLKESGGGTTGRAGTRFRWLVMAELALSMMLVMGASLMLKSTDKVANYDFGYDARGLLQANLSFGWRDSTPAAERQRIISDMLARIRALPGARSAAMMVGCNTDHRLVTSDITVPGGENLYLRGSCRGVGDGFFQTIGMPLVEGRDFSPGDAALGGAVVLGERAARRLFAHERAVGRMVKLGPLASNLPWLRVVGVVRDQPLDFNAFPEMGPDTSVAVYAVLPQFATLTQFAGAAFLVRPERGARGLEVGLERMLKSAAPARGWAQVQPWQLAFQERLRSERFLSLVFALLGAASLVLGAAGLFSVISYVASQRLREFAVRLALGATRDNVLRLVLHEGLVMALGGTAVGAGLGMWAGFLLWDKMWGVYPVDAGALIAGEATLLVVTMLSCMVPAVRATRADPAEVLRAS